MKCPECGMKIPNSAKRCPYCREPISSTRQLFGTLEQAKDDYKKGKEKGEEFEKKHPATSNCLEIIIIIGILIALFMFF